jgi:DNA-binding NtrC family response regulator
LHTQPSASGLTLVELDAAASTVQVVGVSAAWRKLLMQADMAAPHLQVAAIEGEHGTGKHTLARYLFSRSPLAYTSFQRREDIASLAQFLLDRLCARYQQRPVALGPGTLARLLQHSWPGNVRELASVLEAALLEVENGVIRPVDLALPDGLHTLIAVPPGVVPTAPFASLDPPSAVPAAGLSLDAVIRQHVLYILDLNHGNKLRAARQLAISRSTLYRILANENLLAR